MTQQLPIRDRWVDRHPDGAQQLDDVGARAGSLLRAVPEPATLSAAQLERVQRRLSSPGAALGWRWSAGILPVLALVGLWASRRGEPTTTHDLPSRSPVVETAAPPPTVALAPPATIRAPVATAPASLAPPASGATPNRFASTTRTRRQATPMPSTPALSGPAEPETRLAGQPASLSDPDGPNGPDRPDRSDRPGVPAATDLGEETRLLGAAVSSLRVKHDASAALARLDEYRARFPNGTLRPEAELARVDAVLSLGRRAEALRLLEGLDPSRTVRARELRVLRGELRSAAGRCAEAANDFAGVFEGHDALEERARHGRATCRARSNDWPGASADLSDYLRRFPEGRFAAEARRRLAEHPLVAPDHAPEN